MKEPRIRPMRLSDLPAVMEVGGRSLPRPWSEAVWSEEFYSPFGLYLILEEGGALSGFIGLKLLISA